MLYSYFIYLCTKTLSCFLKTFKKLAEKPESPLSFFKCFNVFVMSLKGKPPSIFSASLSISLVTELLSIYVSKSIVSD